MHITMLMGMKIWGGLVVRKPVKTLFNHWTLESSFPPDIYKQGQLWETVM